MTSKASKHDTARYYRCIYASITPLLICFTSDGVVNPDGLKVFRLGKASVELTAYCRLPSVNALRQITRDLLWTYRMSTTRIFFTQSRLRIHHYFLRLTGQNISCIEHQKSRASIVVPYLHPQYLKHLGRCVYFVLFFFQNIDILYPLFNHLSRKILNYFNKCGVVI